MPILAASSSQPLWFASRGTGVVCLLLLTASVVLGIITSVRFETRHWPRFVLQHLHRNVSLLILVFIALHVATTVIDGFVPIGYLDALIPFRSPYRTIWLGLGAVALDLLLALAITSLVRARLGYRVWRAVHWAAYACFPIAVMHALGTGSDAREPWMLALDAFALASVCAATGWRILVAWRPERSELWGAVAALVVVPLGVGAWAYAGPLQPGWAQAKPTATERIAAREPEHLGFASTVSGTRAITSGANGTTAVTVALRGNVAGTTLRVHLDLVGRSRNGVIQLRHGSIGLGPTRDASRWHGPVTALTGGHVTGQVTDSTGLALFLDLELTVDSTGHAFTGSISARPIAGPTASGKE